MEKILAMTDDQIHALCRLEGRDPKDEAKIAKQVCEVALLKYELARERELLRDCHGALDEWRRLLDHSGAQNATHIMRLENVNKILSRITAALKQEAGK